jgi:hypothetical protein
VLPHAFLRGQHLDELAQFLGDDVPAHPDVATERERFVLGGDENAPQPGVDAVAEGEIDDAVGTAEVDRRLGSFTSEGREALAYAPCQQNYQDVVEVHEAVTRETWP